LGFKNNVLGSPAVAAVTATIAAITVVGVTIAPVSAIAVVSAVVIR
jgi:hypothetical protein